jgi:hypothetical protein
MQLAILPCLHVIIISDYLKNVDFPLKVYELLLYIFSFYINLRVVLTLFCRYLSSSAAITWLLV